MKALFTLLFFGIIVSCQAGMDQPSDIRDSSDFRIPILDYGQITDVNGKINFYFEISGTNVLGMKPKEAFDILSSQGKSYTFRLLEIKTTGSNKKIIAETSSNFEEMMTYTGIDFVMANVGAKWKNVNTGKEEISSDQLNPDLTAILNGKKWRAYRTPNGALFYAKGLAEMDSKDKPYLQLSFQSTDEPDNRQLLISVVDFNGLGLPKEMEINLSGAENGKSADAEIQGYVKGPNKAFPSTNFILKITRWEKITNGNFILDAEFSGRLKGVLLSEDVTIEDGKISNLEVRVFTDAY